MRDEGPKEELVVIAAADPLNLVGILTSHERVTSNAANRIAYLDGVPVAALVAREVRYFVEPTESLRRLLQEGRVLQRHARVESNEEAAQTKDKDRGGRNGKPTEAAVKKRRAQKSLFPGTIPRPFVR